MRDDRHVPRSQRIGSFVNPHRVRTVFWERPPLLLVRSRWHRLVLRCVYVGLQPARHVQSTWRESGYIVALDQQWLDKARRDEEDLASQFPRRSPGVLRRLVGQIVER